jgi:hypothetical protein
LVADICFSGVIVATLGSKANLFCCFFSTLFLLVLPLEVAVAARLCDVRILIFLFSIQFSFVFSSIIKNHCCRYFPYYRAYCLPTSLHCLSSMFWDAASCSVVYTVSQLFHLRRIIQFPGYKFKTSSNILLIVRIKRVSYTTINIFKVYYMLYVFPRINEIDNKEVFQYEWHSQYLDV